MIKNIQIFFFFNFLKISLNYLIACWKFSFSFKGKVKLGFCYTKGKAPVIKYID